MKRLAGWKIYEIAEKTNWAQGTSGVPVWVEDCLEAQLTQDKADAEATVREKLNDIEDYLSLMGNPDGTPEYYMISKEDWLRIKGESDAVNR